MIVTTTPTIQGHDILEYKGIVAGETIIGANFFKDFKASLSDFFGGRSGAYEKVLIKAREKATEEMIEHAEKLGANAIVGIDYDYETIGAQNSMLMVSVTGTAVKI